MATPPPESQPCALRLSLSRTILCLSSPYLHDKVAYGDVESNSGGTGLGTHTARHHAADYALMRGRCVAGVA